MRTWGIVLGPAALLAMAGCSVTPSEPEPEPAATSSSSDQSAAPGSQLPGGSLGADVLEKAGWLTPEGLVRFGETAPADDVQAALCDYLVGPPEEVADVALLEGEVSLDVSSGYQSLGGTGAGTVCAYAVGDEATYAVLLWTTADTADTAAVSAVSLTLGNGLFATSAYGPGYDGPTLDDETAERWLREAGARVLAG